MNARFPYVITDQTLTVYVNGEARGLHRTNKQFDTVVKYLNSEIELSDEQFEDLFVPAEEITAIGVEFEDGQLFYNNEIVNSALADRIMDITSLGLDPEPWVKFAENVYANPNDYSREELYLFLEASNLPITPDGCFLAFKKVRSNYKDCHSGTFDNSVGQVVSLDGPHSVDPDRDNLCSQGLHFCSREYLSAFNGDRTMIVKINPRDVVSIPRDYNNSKGRCWRYEVVAEVDSGEVKTMTWHPITDTDDDDNLVDVTTPAPKKENKKRRQSKKVMSDKAGEITKRRFKEMLAEHGSMKKIADHYGVSAGTVQTWKNRLFS